MGVKIADLVPDVRIAAYVHPEDGIYYQIGPRQPAVFVDASGRDRVEMVPEGCVRLLDGDGIEYRSTGRWIAGRGMEFVPVA